ncbi:unnamed protein product [Phaeothamnion confervicola]
MKLLLGSKGLPAAVGHLARHICSRAVCMLRHCKRFDSHSEDAAVREIRGRGWTLWRYDFILTLVCTSCSPAPFCYITPLGIRYLPLHSTFQNQNSFFLSQFWDLMRGYSVMVHCRRKIAY